MTARTAMVICPHADDAAAFCGATIAKFSSEGWRVVLVRVTNDATDAAGHGREAAIQQNTEELHRAAEILGVREVVELGYETDCLADVSEVALRERIVYLFRKYKPYAVFSFDPFGLYEGNMDHIRVAQAVEEAYWVSCFQLHHPEHLREGLELFSVCERWYYARQLPEVTHVEDVTDFLERKIDALCAHGTMMRHMIYQVLLQLKTWGRRVPVMEEALIEGPRSVLAQFLESQAGAVAREGGLREGAFGESFRLVRFGALEQMIQENSEAVPNVEAPPRRDSLDRYWPET